MVPCEELVKRCLGKYWQVLNAVQLDPRVLHQGLPYLEALPFGIILGTDDLLRPFIPIAAPSLLAKIHHLFPHRGIVLFLGTVKETSVPAVVEPLHDLGGFLRIPGGLGRLGRLGRLGCLTGIGVGVGNAVPWSLAAASVRCGRGTTIGTPA